MRMTTLPTNPPRGRLPHFLKQHHQRHHADHGGEEVYAQNHSRVFLVLWHRKKKGSVLSGTKCHVYRDVLDDGLVNSHRNRSEP